MKRALSGIIMVLLFVSISAGASADIASVHVDDFYWRNASKFDYSVNGMYYVNSEDGYVTAWTSPSATKQVKNIANGTLIHVAAEYKGWATSTYLADEKSWTNGNMWFPADKLTADYDGESFEKEYEAEITASGEYANYFEIYETQEQLCFYTYPGSGQCCDMILPEEMDIAPQLQKVFTDTQGRHWAYCESYGYREIGAWICIEEAENPQMPVTLDKSPVLKAEPADIDEQLPALKYKPVVSGLVYAAYAGVGVAVIGAGVLIYSMKGRKKKPETAGEQQV